MLRAILAVVAGFILWTVLWLGTNSILSIATPNSFNENGSTDSVAILSIMLVASVICSLAAGYLTARLSPANRSRTVMILAILLFLVGLFVEIQFWAVLPVWYHLIFLVLLIPATIFGGRLFSGSNA